MFRDPPAIFSPPARMILPPHVFGCYTRVALFESLKIVLAGIAAAVFYGIIHDQFTARICLEYFTVFHPPIFDTQSPTLLALGWGTIATWWAGAILGFLFALAARVGSRPKLSARSLVRLIATLLLVMAVSATITGVLGFVLTRLAIVSPPDWVSSVLPPTARPRFMADLYAHTASYAVGLVGGAMLYIAQFRRRGTMRTV